MPNNTRERFIDDFFNDNYRRLVGNRSIEQDEITVPSANIRKVEQAYLIEFAVPGFKREDFKIEVNQGLLTVSGERKLNKEQSDTTQYSRREFNYLTFSRSFTLPEIAQENEITAKYIDGMLNVQIPVQTEVNEKQPKLIAIN